VDRSFFNSIQIYRGIAAIMVLFHHTWNNVSYCYQLNYEWLDLIARGGKFGIDFFFVLSGFIICFSNYDMAGKRLEAVDYLKRRALRIYLPYWPIGIFMLIMYFCLPGMSGSDRSVNVIKSLTLFPISGQTALSVAWTLVFEVFFYVVFTLWFFSKRFFLFYLVVWIALIFFVNISPGSFMDGIKFIGSAYNIEFIIGVLTAILVKKIKFKRIIISVVLMTVIACFVLFDFDLLTLHILLGIAFAAILLVSMDTLLDKVNPSNFFMIIGNASYSIYLVHNPVISFLLRLFFITPFLLDFRLAVVVICLFSIGVGLIYSKVFERHLLGRVRMLFF
jgi:exopolysaccharide production protein ExoZ